MKKVLACLGCCGRSSAFSPLHHQSLHRPEECLFVPRRTAKLLPNDSGMISVIEVTTTSFMTKNPKRSLGSSLLLSRKKRRGERTSPTQSSTVASYSLYRLIETSNQQSTHKNEVCGILSPSKRSVEPRRDTASILGGVLLLAGRVFFLFVHHDSSPPAPDKPHHPATKQQQSQFARSSSSLVSSSRRYHVHSILRFGRR